MKFLDKIIIMLGLLIVLVSIMLWIFRCERNKKEPCPPEGMILIRNSFVDSLRMIAEQVPDTIIDTIFIPAPDIYTQQTEPVEQILRDERKMVYSEDSLITPYYKVWIADWIRDNNIISRDWNYTLPEQRIITRTIEKPIIYPVTLKEKIDNPLHQVILDAGIGIGTTGIPYKVGIDYIGSKNIKYGIQYQKINKVDFLMADVGFVIASW